MPCIIALCTVFHQQSSVETMFLPLPFSSNVLMVIVHFLYSDETIALKSMCLTVVLGMKCDFSDDHYCLYSNCLVYIVIRRN